MKPGNLNFLEPSGPFQDCKGTALPLLIEWEMFQTKGVEKTKAQFVYSITPSPENPTIYEMCGKL